MSFIFKLWQDFHFRIQVLENTKSITEIVSFWNVSPFFESRGSYEKMLITSADTFSSLIFCSSRHPFGIKICEQWKVHYSIINLFNFRYVHRFMHYMIYDIFYCTTSESCKSIKYYEQWVSIWAVYILCANWACLTIYGWGILHRMNEYELMNVWFATMRF